MCPYKKISFLIIFVILIISLPPTARGQMTRMIVKPSITHTTSGLSVAYEIRNMGTDTVGHLTVTTFLARNTNHSDVLGDVPRGETLRYNLVLNTSDLLPGEYIMATRINFSGPDGRTHRTYHFSGITIKPAGIKKDVAALAFHLQSPAINLKSFWHPRGKFALTMENNLGQNVEPVVIFFLPDGSAVSEPEKVYTLAAQEKRVEKIPLTFDSSVGADSPYYALVWYDVNGMHYSQLFNGTIRVEAAPIYFKLFVVLCIIIVLALAVIYIFRRRKNTAGT
jgi:hypothetical protein